MPFNFNPPVDKSRRSYVPFPEEGFGNTPPPVPSRPHSMLLSGNPLTQVGVRVVRAEMNTSSSTNENT